MWTCRDIRAGLNSGEVFVWGFVTMCTGGQEVFPCCCLRVTQELWTKPFLLAKQQPGFLLVFREGLCARQSQAAEQDNKA